MLAGGKWSGRQVVPKAWLDASLRPAAVVDDKWVAPVVALRQVFLASLAESMPAR